jgi:broad specificity phosphatase PhoE
MLQETTCVREQTVWLTRHGERIDFVEPSWKQTAKRLYDPPLSAQGVIQAQQLGRRLAGEGIEHIFASPFLRTIETAFQIAEILDLAINLEYGLGEWLSPQLVSTPPSYLTASEIPHLFSRVDQSYVSRGQNTHPETWQAMLDRTRQTLEALLTDYPDNILLVGHGATVTGLAQALLNGGPKVETGVCGLVKLVRQEEQWQLQLNGDVSHLSKTQNNYSGVWV